MEDDFKQLSIEVNNHTIEINDIKQLLMGPPPNRNNGIRGNVIALTKKLDDAIKCAQHIWDVKRREECLGLKAIEELKVDIDKKFEEGTSVKIAQINLRGVYFMNAIQVLGLIIVAIIGLKK